MSDDLQGLLSLVALAIVFFALIPHDTKMKIGETVLHERKQQESTPQESTPQMTDHQWELWNDYLAILQIPDATFEDEKEAKRAWEESMRL